MSAFSLVGRIRDKTPKVQCGNGLLAESHTNVVKARSFGLEWTPETSAIEDEAHARRGELWQEAAECIMASDKDGYLGAVERRRLQAVAPQLSIRVQRVIYDRPCTAPL